MIDVKVSYSGIPVDDVGDELLSAAESGLEMLAGQIVQTAVHGSRDPAAVARKGRVRVKRTAEGSGAWIRFGPYEGIPDRPHNPWLGNAVAAAETDLIANEVSAAVRTVGSRRKK